MLLLWQASRLDACELGALDTLILDKKLLGVARTRISERHPIDLDRARRIRFATRDKLVERRREKAHGGQLEIASSLNAAVFVCCGRLNTVVGTVHVQNLNF